MNLFVIFCGPLKLKIIIRVPQTGETEISSPFKALTMHSNVDSVSDRIDFTKFPGAIALGQSM
jgi:hypothetical protein